MEAGAILDGESPIKVWRKYRGLTQRQLVDKVKISMPYLSQIETGKRMGATEILSAIAKALDVSQMKGEVKGAKKIGKYADGRE